MLPRLQMTTIVLSVLLVLLVLELLRRGRLREEYAVLWLLLPVGLSVLALSHGALQGLTAVFGVRYPPSAVFAAGLVGALGLFLHFTVVISHLTRKTVALAQEVAILRARLEEPPEGEGARRGRADPAGSEG